jgi:3'(2'), 5'-bisphosphate nucleotidase
MSNLAQQWRDEAVAAVRRACVVCRAVQADLASIAMQTKDDRSPVTVADYASQAVVCDHLHRAGLRGSRADVPMVAEEGADALRAADPALRTAVAHHAGMTEDDAVAAVDRGGADPPAEGQPWWTLDPIDGTKGFLRGEQYAVALALVEDGQVVLGVLGCPNLGGGAVLVARRGHGVVRLPVEDVPGDGEPIGVAPVHEPADLVLVESVESGHSDQDQSVQVMKHLGATRPPLRMDSQCKYAAVAAGDASVYLRLPTRPGYQEKVWDHAAGMLCVEEAGGTVTDVDGKPLAFTHGRTLAANRGVIATAGPMHDRVVAAVSKSDV